jgi:hypothetical protein
MSKKNNGSERNARRNQRRSIGFAVFVVSAAALSAVDLALPRTPQRLVRTIPIEDQRVEIYESATRIFGNSSISAQVYDGTNLTEVANYGLTRPPEISLGEGKSLRSDDWTKGPYFLQTRVEAD